MDEKFEVNENLLEHKARISALRMKSTSDKKDALAAQFAAEASLRRLQLHANQKDDESPPLASVVAPFEAEIKMYKNEEHKKAFERLSKSKESALLEAERILRSALERALIVEEVQKQNHELRRQIEICQARQSPEGRRKEKGELWVWGWLPAIRKMSECSSLYD